MYKEFKPNVASECRNNQQSPSHGGPMNGPTSTHRGSSLSKNTSFKSDQSVASVESANEGKKMKKK